MVLLEARSALVNPHVWPHVWPRVRPHYRCWPDLRRERFAIKPVPAASLALGHGNADYLLYVDRQAVGAVEAKPAGFTLTGVKPQIDKYSKGLPANLPAPIRQLPFLYVSTGVETNFVNLLDPEPRSRRVFSFHRPETISEWLQANNLPDWVRRELVARGLA